MKLAGDLKRFYEEHGLIVEAILTDNKTEKGFRTLIPL